MDRTPLVSTLLVLTIGLWLAALTAAVISSDGGEAAPLVFILTRPVVTALTATLSIGLIAWRLTRPLVKASVIYSVGFDHGRKAERATPTVAADEPLGVVREIRRLR